MTQRNRIGLACASCGPVTVDAGTGAVHRNPRDGFALYAVPCPGCAELLVGGCAERIAALERAGATRFELRCPSAPAISYDDLLSFHEWLETDPVWPTDTDLSS